jgi:DNA-binding response OmpR family regulator
MQVLVVEDEKRLAEALVEILSREKYLVDQVHDGASGLAFAETGTYDVIVLDVMLPQLNGFDLVRQLRAGGITTPVLLLTAKGEIGDKVMGLDCGADDYMTKPFSPEEFLARIRALTRRQEGLVLGQLSFADLELHLDTYLLYCRGKSVRLGFKEFEVLKLLMANSSMVVPKEDIIVKVWGTESGAEDNNVEAYVSFLRKKFNYLGSAVNIGTLRKVGYRLETEVR